METEIGSKTLTAGSEQVVVAWKHHKWHEIKVSLFRMVDHFFIQPRSVCAENLGTVRLHVIECGAVWRGNDVACGDDTARVASESGHRPDFIATERSAVIDFLAIGRETFDELVRLILGELKGFAAGSKHEEYFLDASDR